MHRLFEASKFARSCTEIRYEQERINLFACCRKKWICRRGLRGIWDT